MGLDYSIYVKIKNKKTNNQIACIEIAYWRKCWTLRTATMGIATANKDNIIMNDNDFLFEVKTNVLENIISCLSSAITDRNNIIFTDSIWGKETTRQLTIKQLSRMCPWDSLFSCFDNILAANVSDKRIKYIKELDDIIYDIETDSEFPRDDISLSEILMNFEEYEFSLEIDNSY